MRINKALSEPCPVRTCSVPSPCKVPPARRNYGSGTNQTRFRQEAQRRFKINRSKFIFYHILIFR